MIKPPPLLRNSTGARPQSFKTVLLSFQKFPMNTGKRQLSTDCSVDCGGCTPQYPAQLSGYYNISVSAVMSVTYHATYDVSAFFFYFDARTVVNTHFKHKLVFRQDIYNDI